MSGTEGSSSRGYAVSDSISGVPLSASGSGEDCSFLGVFLSDMLCWAAQPVQ